MEFKLQEVKPVPVVFNYDELKKDLEITLKGYSNYVVDEHNLSIAKSDMAKLNKVKKALNDKKIEVKKTILQDYELFENQVKELISMVDDGVSSIKKQTDEFELERIQAKKNEIKLFFDAYNKGGLLKLEQIYNPKWENKGYSLDNIKKEIIETISRVFKDVEVIDSLNESSESIKLLKIKYLNTLDLTKTLNDFNVEKEILAKLEEMQKNANKQQNNDTSTITLDNTQTSNHNAKTSVKTYSSVFKFIDNVENMKKLKKFLDETGIKYEILENMKEVY